MLYRILSLLRKVSIVNKMRQFDLASAISCLPLIYHLRKLRYKIEFDFGGNVRFFGAFGSYNKALNGVPNNAPSSYADADLSEINLNSFLQMHLFDYPILHWLIKLSGDYKSIIDFGGHVGVKYYAYQKQFQELSRINWQVIDVPGMIKKGREIANQKGVDNIYFRDNIGSAEPSEILFISGALQYLDVSIDQLLDKMKDKPLYIFLNKLPLHDGENVWTLENFGDAKIPYGIFNRAAFHSVLEHQGYQRIDRWTINSRSITIPFSEHAVDKFAMEGHVWKLNLQ